jgi:hypothetical protein
LSTKTLGHSQADVRGAGLREDGSETGLLAKYLKMVNERQRLCWLKKESKRRLHLL